MQFEVGDKVVYPTHGIGVIEGVMVRRMGGQEIHFYQLRLAETKSVVMVPTQNTEVVGIRRIVSPPEAQELLFHLQKPCHELDVVQREWKSRFKENTEKMKTGLLGDVVDVLKVLSTINNQKSLSFREKKMYDRARRLVVSEIAAVEDTPEEQVEARIDGILLQT